MSDYAKHWVSPFTAMMTTSTDLEYERPVREALMRCSYCRRVEEAREGTPCVHCGAEYTPKDVVR